MVSNSGRIMVGTDVLNSATRPKCEPFTEGRRFRRLVRALLQAEMIEAGANPAFLTECGRLDLTLLIV